MITEGSERESLRARASGPFVSQKFAYVLEAMMTTSLKTEMVVECATSNYMQARQTGFSIMIRFAYDCYQETSYRDKVCAGICAVDTSGSVRTQLSKNTGSIGIHPNEYKVDLWFCAI